MESLRDFTWTPFFCCWEVAWCNASVWNLIGLVIIQLLAVWPCFLIVKWVETGLLGEFKIIFVMHLTHVQHMAARTCLLLLSCIFFLSSVSKITALIYIASVPFVPPSVSFVEPVDFYIEFPSLPLVFYILRMALLCT